MPDKQRRGPRSMIPSTEVWHLARKHGITRDQARRLINKFGKNNPAKLDEATAILKARYSPHSNSLDG